MISYTVSNVKGFMNLLLRTSVFDDWAVREIRLNTLVRYTISGELNKAFLSEEEQRSGDYALWADLKETMFSLIKGRKQPTLMQFTLAYPKEMITDVSTETIESFLINIHYENQVLKVITATSTRTFTLERDAEQFWDGFVAGFLEKQGLEVEKD